MDLQINHFGNSNFKVMPIFNWTIVIPFDDWLRMIVICQLMVVSNLIKNGHFIHLRSKETLVPLRMHAPTVPLLLTMKKMEDESFGDEQQLETMTLINHYIWLSKGRLRTIKPNFFKKCGLILGHAKALGEPTLTKYLSALTG